MTDHVAERAAPDVELFDPPLCCPTGLCGPVLDTTLVDLNESIIALQAEGRTVVRRQMAAEPQAFMKNADVYRLIRERQLEVLPITVVRGRVVKTDEYPSLADLRRALDGLDALAPTPDPQPRPASS